MCLAVEYIHDLNLVHRDISKYSFLLNGRGIVKLDAYRINLNFKPNQNFYYDKLSEAVNQRTSYISPEVILSPKGAFNYSNYS